MNRTKNNPFIEMKGNDEFDIETDLWKNFKSLTISTETLDSVSESQQPWSSQHATYSTVKSPLLFGDSAITPQVPVSYQTWFYSDPYYREQGPFTSREMAEWYRYGYFDNSLILRRVCDSRYSTIGELISISRSKIPFLASHLIPPLQRASVDSVSYACTSVGAGRISLINSEKDIKTIKQPTIQHMNLKTDSVSIDNKEMNNLKEIELKEIADQMQRMTSLRETHNKLQNQWRAVAAARLASPNESTTYVEVQFGNEIVKGILDDGTTISCLGSGVLELLKRLDIEWKKYTSDLRTIKTESGSPQKIVGHVITTISYQGHTIDQFKLLVIPGLAASLHLGTDFSRRFNIAATLPSLSLPFDFGYKDYTVRSRSEKCLNELDNKQVIRLEHTKSLFASYEKQGLGMTRLECHVIDIGHTAPIQCPVPSENYELIYPQLDKMLECGIIEACSSCWNSEVIILRKDGNLKICLDFRRLNAVTKRDVYSLAWVDGVLKKLKKAEYISCIDLKSIYWQIPLEKKSQKLTAFTVPGRTSYQFTRMPFGLINAPQRICRLMDKVLPAKLREYTVVYLDDLLVFSEGFDFHIELLTDVADCLRRSGITVNIEKSQFCLSTVTYLGHIVGSGCLRPDSENWKMISGIFLPQTNEDLASFLEISNWYRRFVINFNKIVTPLLSARVNGPNNRKLTLGTQAVRAFSLIKRILTADAAMVEPDFHRSFFIQCNASMTQVAGLLYQIDCNGKEHPIAYHIHKLSGSQKQYSVTELECLAIIRSLREFRPYIEGKSFHIVTDRSILLWLMNQTGLSNLLSSWCLELQAFNFTIEERVDNRNGEPIVLERINASKKHKIEIELRNPKHIFEDYEKQMDELVKSPNQYPDLKILNELIYCRRYFSTGYPMVDRSVWKLWIPHKLTQMITQEAHETPHGPHRNKYETVALLRTEYFWPSMSSQVDSLLENCRKCKPKIQQKIKQS